MKRARGVRLLVAVAAVALVLSLASCLRWMLPARPVRAAGVAPIRPDEGEVVELTVTGYCNCGSCCGWRRKWFLFGSPVYDYGKMKGKPKIVGRTASGTTARPGTLAADVRVFPFGTRMEIPGYGTGVVEDIGGAVKGNHVDAWFESHEEARAWGVKKLKARVVRPAPSR